MEHRLNPGFLSVGGSQRPPATLLLGLKALLAYLRLEGNRPISLRPKSIAKRLAGRISGSPDRHYLETALGHALRDLEERGYVFRAGRGRPARYIMKPRLTEILETYGCNKRWECDKESACGLIGTPECPFLVGYGGDGSGSHG